jgi:hypothetical protein
VAGAPLSDPHPFVLLGTLLFALAAAAGQVLRSDPRLFRRMVDGFDGVRRATDLAPGSGTSTASTGAAGPVPDPQHGTTGGTTGSAASDPVADWPTGTFDDVSVDGPAAPDRVGVTSADSYATLDGTQHVDPSTLSSQPPDASSQMAPQQAGGADGQAGGQASGQGSGLDNIAKGQAGSFDGFAKTIPDGVDGFAEGGSPLSNPGPASSPAAPADGSVGGHASGAGDHLAKGAGPSGDAFGTEIGTNGNGFAQAADSAGQGGPATGIGGSQGSAGKVAFGATPPVDGTGLAGPPGPPDGGLSSGPGVDAGLSESLEALARSLPPTHGVGTANAGSEAAVDPSHSTLRGFEPSWLGAGALARAPRPELPAALPSARTFSCSACGRQLTYGHRFCGYCGEPLDKTMA